MNPATERRRQALLAALAANPDDSFTRYALALEYRSAGDTAEAQRALEELRRRDPNYVALYYQLGKLYLDGERTADARETFLAGIALAKNLHDPHTENELQTAFDATYDESLRDTPELD